MGSEQDRLLSEFRRLWEDPAVELFEAHTSGSTGIPKQIMLPRGDMEASARATIAAFGLDSGSRLHCPLSMNYIAGKMMAVRAILAGCSITLEEPSTAPLSLLDNSDRVDLLPIVPVQIPALAERLSQEDAPDVRNIIVGGAPCTAAQEEILRQLPAQVYATYGMTETCSHVALRSVTRDEKQFTAMPGVLFSTDSRGCLVISSSGFSWGRLETNDLVELLSPASFIWLGRADNAIITGGLKVIPELLEQKIAKYLPAGSVFYITSMDSAKWGREVVLVAEGKEVDHDAISFASLPPHERPHHIIWLSVIPRTSSGKIIRQNGDDLVNFKHI